MRVPSDHKCSNGGWIHFDDSRNGTMVIRDYTPPPLEAVRYWHWLKKRQTREHDNELVHLSKATGGIPVSFLRECDVLWEPERRAAAFCMLDGDGRRVGVRLRWPNGEKGSIAGSKSGIVYDNHIHHANTAYVVEGQTDYLIMRYMGFATIGRQSCVGCEEMVSYVVERWGCERVVIVMDVDEPKECNGVLRLPGRSGAIRLASFMRPVVKFACPKRKDIRQWVLDDGVEKVKSEVEKW